MSYKIFRREKWNLRWIEFMESIGYNEHIEQIAISRVWISRFDYNKSSSEKKVHPMHWWMMNQIKMYSK